MPVGCLMPTLCSNTLNVTSSPDIRFTNVEFDDGDSGKIPLDHIRQLPSDFPLVCKYYNAIPQDHKLPTKD
jgi:hypothetical protein